MNSLFYTLASIVAFVFYLYGVIKNFNPDNFPTTMLICVAWFSIMAELKGQK